MKQQMKQYDQPDKTEAGRAEPAAGETAAKRQDPGCSAKAQPGERASAAPEYDELVHLGSGIVNPSGNLARSYSDMSMKAPGFTIMVSRAYNSTDARASLFSTGWSFGFQSVLASFGNDAVIRMPDGSGRNFTLESGAYTAKDSRAKLTKSGSEYVLTTPDYYRYRYNAKGYMDLMTDPNGNEVNISVDANGKVTAVTDAAGRTLTIDYADNRICGVTESVTSRHVAYAYDANGRLSQATAPDGGNTYYEYNAAGLLERVKDHDGAVLEEFTYEDLPNGGKIGIKTAKLPAGHTEVYDYDPGEKKVTSTAGNRTVTAWFDEALYPVRIIDAEDGERRFSYNSVSDMPCCFAYWLSICFCDIILEL